jgi:signal transduction histidine kinase
LLQIRFGLQPLKNLRAGLSAIRRGEAERIPGEYPQDIAPLAQDLNLLLDTNREILERARTQVGNLAHALKTPLSVIVNEVENAPDDVAAKVREQAAVMRDQVNYHLDRAPGRGACGYAGLRHGGRARDPPRSRAPSRRSIATRISPSRPPSRRARAFAASGRTSRR